MTVAGEVYSGGQSASTAAKTMVLRFLWSPFFPAPLAARVARIDVESPSRYQINKAALTQTKMQLAQNLLKRIVITPLSEMLVDGFPKAEALRKIPPFGPGAQDPQDTVKHLAAVASGGDPDADIAAFDRQQAVNGGGVVTAVAWRWATSDGGRIISLGTTDADHVPFLGLPTMSGPKPPSLLTAGSGPRPGTAEHPVNVIQPIAINTALNSETANQASFLAGLAALGRNSQPEDIVAAASFLAGPEAFYITGATLNVDGGQNA